MIFSIRNGRVEMLNPTRPAIREQADGTYRLSMKYIGCPDVVNVADYPNHDAAYAAVQQERARYAGYRPKVLSDPVSDLPRAPLPSGQRYRRIICESGDDVP